MFKRRIRNVAVLGSGVMGSRLACHFANAGVQVLLLDIVPGELTGEEQKNGLSLQDKKVRNRIAADHLKHAVASDPSPLYKKSFASRIAAGNFEDDMDKLAGMDWILEAVVENLDIKKAVFEKAERFRKPGTLVTTNTSGIPIKLMLDGRSEDFKKHFCGTHFFNPPRYLRLLEVIPSPETLPEVTSFLKHYGEVFLGKAVVECKDTPAFIANRIGVFAIASIFHLMKKTGLGVDEVDRITGPLTGRPKSATFRTCDLVGIDTLVKVMDDLYKNCPSDEAREMFKAPDFVRKMVENKWLGEKSAQGFYKKVKNKDGKSEILTLDTGTFEYGPKKKVKFATLESVKQVDDLRERLRQVVKGKDKAAEFYRHLTYAIFAYVSRRIPEITDAVYKIDEALCAGFGWEMGPFETWDALGLEYSLKEMEKHGYKAADWVYGMAAKGRKSFYLLDDGRKKYYDIDSGAYADISGQAGLVLLDAYKKDKIVWKNTGCTLMDIGDEVLCLEFHTKMNTIGGEVLEGLNRSVELAEKQYAGLVIGNEAVNFSAGANLAMLFMMAAEQEYEEIDLAIRMFQNTMMRVRCSAVPVVAAPRGLALGGGCEMSLHADSVVAAAETYIGLVEVGAGLIPAGGGSKEFTLRASDSFAEGDVELNRLQQRFLTIATAKVATSAHEAFDLGIFRHGQDLVVMNQNRVLSEAKKRVLQLAQAGYTAPVPRKDIRVLGRTALAAFLAGTHAFMTARYATAHDKKISEKLAYVMCGGDLSAPALVTEQYLLDLEREAFLSLCGEKKTLERIQSILTTGRPLRN